MKRRIFKPFFAWQVKREEEWLNKMGEKGWALKRYFPFFYLFIKKSSKVYYKTDFEPVSGLRKKRYSEQFQENGWEHGAEWLGWHYFYREADKEMSELPLGSYEQKLRMFLRTISGLLMIFIGLLIVFLISLFYPSRSESHSLLSLSIISVVLIMGILHVLTKLAVKRSQYKKEAAAGENK